MEGKLVYGIQQVGIGVQDADEAFEWYATRLGADVSVFDDSNEATYMAPYMGGKSRKKRAILAMNLQGGSGYEIWQYINRKPTAPAHEVEIGDLGINTAFIKSSNVEVSYARLKGLDANLLTEIHTEEDGKKCFYLKDPGNNILKIKEFNSWYKKGSFDLGGVFGSQIGVSNIENSMKLFSDVLGYDVVVYDKTGVFEDLKGLPNGGGEFRRVLLSHKPGRKGGFSRLLGDSQLELIQRIDSTPRKIFENRYWGDLGFIHLCFDIRNMEKLTEECAAGGFPFKVLSAESFEMGDANGHWGYIEDPDGTLIEFVETHKVPLIKPINLNINLRNRDPEKCVPNWMIRAMGLKRVKFG